MSDNPTIADINKARERRQSSGQSGKETITFSPATPDQTADATEAAIIRAGFPVMHRAGALVMPHIEKAKTYGGGETKVTTLKPIGTSRIIDMMTKSANWSRWSNRERKYLPALPPEIAAKILLARGGEWKFPRVSAIITSPSLRPDGSLLLSPGYDQETQLYLESSVALAPEDIPEHPTKEDAKRALVTLKEPLEEFPFVSEIDLSVALAMEMTPVLRRRPNDRRLSPNLRLRQSLNGKPCLRNRNRRRSPNNLSRLG